MATTSVSLSPHLRRFVAGLVASGRYQNASEVMRAALRLLENEEQGRRGELVATNSSVGKVAGREET